MMLRTTWAAVLLILCLVFTGLPRSKTGLASTQLINNRSDEGLGFRLSSGSEQPPAAPKTRIANAEELSATETDNILRRLPPLTVDKVPENEFSLRDRSLPPPRTGEILRTAFPGTVNSAPPEATPSGPLKVLRHSPVAAVELAPELSVTFSRPMVAVSAQTNANVEVPIQLSPQPRGEWHWVGTRTIVFRPEGRFPMATNYSAVVPAGTQAADGTTLRTRYSWNFTTPAPTVKTTYPRKDQVQPRDALIFVAFDQRINDEDVLRSIKVSTGFRRLPTRLATAEEVEADEEVRELAKATQRDRWLAFRVIDPVTKSALNALPSGSTIQVSIGRGTPSAEGPVRTTKPQGFSFRTFGPLRVVHKGCTECDQVDALYIKLSNPIDAKVFDKALVRVEPAIEDLEVNVYGDEIAIEGFKQSGPLRVLLSPSIKDEFGQTLGVSAPIGFYIRPNPPSLYSSGGDMVVMDPDAPQSFSVFSINHQRLNVKLYSVTPADWPSWNQQMNDHELNNKRPSTLPKQIIFSRTVSVQAKAGDISETKIDLSPGLKDGVGQMLLVVEPGRRTSTHDNLNVWIQRTNIGLDAFIDRSNLVAWATSLKDGSPLANVQLSVASSGGTSSTGADGIARIALNPESAATGNSLIARRGNDVAWISAGKDSRQKLFAKPSKPELRWFVFDDRNIYKPGEEVHVKGWIRQIDTGPTGDVQWNPGSITNLAYILNDSRGNRIKLGTIVVNKFGGFDTTFQLPHTMNLGFGSLELQALTSIAGNKHTHSFQVQEFRRPEYEVATKLETDGPHLVGTAADISVNAKYYAGGGLAGADVNWNVTAKPSSYTPPNREEFTFGKWKPWWTFHHSFDRQRFPQNKSLKALTDADGKHVLHLDFDSTSVPQPYSIVAEARVMDVNRQTWVSSTTLLVHPADLYVGLRSKRVFVKQGEPLLIESIVTDLDGTAITGREISMRATQVNWEVLKGEWKEVEINPQDCSLSSKGDAGKCTFTTPKAGQYRVKASIVDDRGRKNESELTLWVTGDDGVRARNVSDDVQLVPDRKEYRGGEVAEILVLSQFYPAEGVMTLRRSGLLKTERFTMPGPTHTLRVSLEEGWTPNVHVAVDLVGAVRRSSSANSSSRPAFGSASISLSIPPIERRLNVKAVPKDIALEPGGKTEIEVEVKDGAGKAVRDSEVAVLMVDESVLALTDYQLNDPTTAFYFTRQADVETYHLRSNVLIEEEQRVPTGEGGGGPGGGLRGRALGKGDSPDAYSTKLLKAGPTGLFTVYDSATNPIRLRQYFNALALFVPSARTDASGRVTVPVKLPDNLTRYRVMAIAAAGEKQFGAKEAAITARLPLMVRPSAPRFLNYGDEFELPVVLQNQTNRSLTVDVAARATNVLLSQEANATEAVSSAGRRVTVPANDRVEIRFPASATRVGNARVQFAAASGKYSDASDVVLKVSTPATTESFSTYGEIDQGTISQPVQAPSDIFKEFGGLEVETSSTQLQQLTDAVIYLTSYPYECSEQLASRILATAALRDFLPAFKSKELPSTEELNAAIEADIKRLAGMQNDDGGFGFWRRGEKSSPFVSIHVAHALGRAKTKEFAVPDRLLNNAGTYISSIDKRIPPSYSPWARRSLIAYALYVRNYVGDKNLKRAQQLITEAGPHGLSSDALGWLLPVVSGRQESQALANSILQQLNNRVTETAATAHFATSYRDEDYLLLNSNRRTDGIVLESLIAYQPQSDLIPKIVRGLLASRHRGRWLNTQENVFILLALERYFTTYEKTTPNFVARVWLGDAYAGEQKFHGRSNDRQLISVPMQSLDTQSQNLTVAKDGAGRLYYRIGMNYAPRNLNLAAADYGFAVERTYVAVDDPDDVQREADETWRIKAGARVRVRLTMVAPARRYHVALVDPMPAGFEALNPTLAVTETVPRDDKQTGVTEVGSRSLGINWWRWRPVWFDHQNMRDERVEAFTSLLWEGVYTYSYVARATTPGSFVVPPAKAEEMYQPETFGRSKSDRVVIRDR